MIMHSMYADLRRLVRLLRLAGHFVVGPFIAHVLLRLVDYPRQQALSKWWNYKLCRILNLRIHIHGNINSQPTLFVANHISWLDINCLGSVLKAHFVSKQEVREWPVFGAMAARIGTLFLKRGDATVTSMVADQMTWLLLQKKSLVMFPEGTSSDGNSVDRFHARLFQSAIRSRTAVQAVALSFPHEQGVNPLVPFIGDDNLLLHLWKLLSLPVVEVRLTFCKPIFAEGLDRRLLANHTRSQILSTFEFTSASTPREKISAQGS